jgi:hypothetical protein
MGGDESRMFDATNKLAPTICNICVGLSATVPLPELHVATLPTVAILLT